MKVTTKKLDAGRYAVLVDGVPTLLEVENGELVVRREPNDSLEDVVNTICAILENVPQTSIATPSW